MIEFFSPRLSVWALEWEEGRMNVFLQTNQMNYMDGCRLTRKHEGWKEELGVQKGLEK